MRLRTGGDLMNYEIASRVVQQGGTLYFMLIFLAGCAYAFWPKNKQAFREAALLPLKEDDDAQP